MLEDLVFTLRTLLRNPKFSLLTIFVMTTGLSLCIFMYSFLHSTYTAPLPFEGGDRARVLMPITKTSNFIAIRYADYEDLKKSQQSFDIFDAYDNSRQNLMTSDRSFRERVFYVKPTFFDMSEAKPMMGRLLDEDDMAPSAESVVVIGETVWRNLFGGDPDVIGQSFLIESVPHKIVGVMPAEYRFPSVAKIWTPYKINIQGMAREDSPYTLVYGRLKPGVSDDEANADIKQIMNQLAQQFPELNEGESAYVITFQQFITNIDKTMVLAMELSVVLLLLLACINTANLLLSRALEKGKETAICLAIGAPRAKLIRQVMLESTVICLISGVLALLVTFFSLEASMRSLSQMFLASEAPFWWKFELTSNSILMTVLFTISTAVITGLLPAWKATSNDFNAVLRDGTRGAQGKASGRLNSIIVIIEVGLSCALLLVSISMFFPIYEKNQTDYGVRLENTLTAELALPAQSYDTPEKRYSFYTSLKQRLEDDTNVNSVSYTLLVPITWADIHPIAFENQVYDENSTHERPDFVTVGHDYFDTMDISLSEGRTFALQDKLDSPIVAVVTKQFEEKYLNGTSAIGQRFKMVDQDVWYTVIGIVEDVVHGSPFSTNIERPSVFLSLAQNPLESVVITMHTRTDPNTLRNLLNQVTYELEPNAPLFNVRTMDRLQQRAVANLNFILQLFMIFAAASVVLAFSGIYGVIANTVVQKTQEIGVRRALGAPNRDIVVHFLNIGGKQLLVGLIIGFPIGIVITNSLAATELAILSIEVMVSILILISLTVGYAIVNPVNRTLKMEPVDALRHE